MNRSLQIESLRKQHKIAVGNYDFNRAEQIEEQIQRLRMEITQDFENSKHSLDLSLDEQRETVKSRSQKMRASQLLEDFDVHKNFTTRLHEMELRHAEEQRQLATEYDALLEREMHRTIPEVEVLLAEARSHGNARRYSQAKAVYQEAMNLKKHICADRRTNCSAQFVRSQRRLEQRQKREKDILASKKETLETDLKLKRTRQREASLNTMRVKELKAEQERINYKTAIMRATSSQRSNLFI